MKFRWTRVITQNSGAWSEEKETTTEVEIPAWAFVALSSTGAAVVLALTFGI